MKTKLHRYKTVRWADWFRVSTKASRHFKEISWDELDELYKKLMKKTKAPLRFEYWKSVKDKQWYWRIRAGNAEPIAQGEGYKRKAGVLKVFHLLFDFEAQPACVDINDEAYAKWKSSIRGFPAPKKLAKKCCGKGCKKPKGYSGKINRSWP